MPKRNTGRNTGRDARRGFTLVEMLVVLVLTGLVVGLLFEGLSRVADLRVRLVRHLDGALDSAVVGAWFRGSLAALTPDYLGQPGVFAGSAGEMSGLTLQPLDQPAGTLSPFGWRLAADAARGVTRLSYRGLDGSWREVAAWPGAGGRFLYAGPDGDWRSDWPPPLAGGARPGQATVIQQPQLPRFVRLEGGGHAEAWFAAAAIRGTTMPRLTTMDYLKALQ